MTREIAAIWRKDCLPHHRVILLLICLHKIRRYVGWLGVARALVDVARVGWRRDGIVVWFV